MLVTEVTVAAKEGETNESDGSVVSWALVTSHFHPQKNIKINRTRTFIKKLVAPAG